MNYKDTLLYSSLIQVSNISAKKEEKYWKNGIYTLDDLSQLLNQQLTLFGNSEVDEINTIISNDCEDITSIFGNFQKKTGQKDLYRIAYSIPDDVIFLDIETTGLSHVYHYITMIGWINKGKYDYWIVGTNPEHFFKAIDSAKMIVTFNGQRFDIKFIDLLFPELKIREKPHLDLCPFCRRYNLTKGQKNIETTIGYIRPDNINDCDGKEAVVLWYKFLFGSNDSLDSLIVYNYYDVCGMMYILDYIFFNRIYGKLIPKIGKPKNFYKDNCNYKTPISDSMYKTIRSKINSNIFDIKKLKKSDNYCIVGIDLAGVINKTSHTGVSVLNGDIALTKVVTYDEEIELFIKSQNPDIISIDAPLSLPKGRTSVYDDDPMRNEAGITRYCERELKRRGVSSYPALIMSMQELTKRGMKLSLKLRKMGYPIIECFPGAAQDILQIPRKRTDLDLLKTGLIRLGIHGDFEKKKVIHDELDAITAALVAKFFIDGYFESIGIKGENDMIVPSVKKRSMDYKLVVGIAGHIATGKTTVAEYLMCKHNFSYCKYPQIVSEKFLDITTCVDCESSKDMKDSVSLHNFRYSLNESVNSKVIGNPLVVIDGIQYLEDYTFWKERCFSNFYLVYVDTNCNICEQGYSDHYGECVSYNAEKEIESLRNLADFVINNSNTKDALFVSIDSFLKEIDY